MAESVIFFGLMLVISGLFGYYLKLQKEVIR